MSILNAFPGGGGAAKYTHTKSGTVHNFVGAGKLGFAVLTATYASGNTFKVNGVAVTVVGAPDKFEIGGSVLFSIEGTKLYLYDTATLKSIPEYTYTGSSTFIDDGNGDWRLKLLTSGTLKFTDRARDLDVFLVGGGGAGNSGQYTGGGGGGYTLTAQVAATLNAYAVIIGAGGNASNGGTTSAFGRSAAGGKATTGVIGGAGGSGGGAYGQNTNPGGSNGANGDPESDIHPGGVGQGATTREFGEASGALYAGGGGGANNQPAGTPGAGGAGGGGRGGRSGLAAVNGTANTGGGGGGSCTNTSGATNGGQGGSGIVVIRNHRG